MIDYDKVLARLAVACARDEMENALGWTAVLRHEDTPDVILAIYGGFQEPAAALSWAAAKQDEMNDEPGEEGWRCDVLPIMPAL